MKKVLVIYYSQSGQLRQILDRVTQPLKEDGVQVDFKTIEPDPPFPFPWNADNFFDAFPETVLQEPCTVKSVGIDVRENYDLIILGYQTWFLSPSLPVSSFLKSDQAKTLFNNKKVVTVLGVRNMWVMGQEKMKVLLKSLNAELVGNVVLEDKHPNLISVKTIMKWMFTGHKGPYEKLPAAGVSDSDIEHSKHFGKIILKALSKGTYDKLQTGLLQAGAVNIKFHLLRTEIIGSKMFKLWANFVRKKGERGDAKRMGRVRMFRRYLLFMIFVISPVTAVLFKGIRAVFKSATDKIMRYYSGIDLKP